MDRVAAALDQQYPKWSPGRRVRVIPLHEHLVAKVRNWMLMLLGAVALVLLIACANVANLMLVRATVRGREMGIRAALGASRWRLIRAMLIEGLLLSLIGAAIGLLLAYLGVRGIIAWLPAGLPRVASIGLDLRVLFAATATAAVSGMLFGIVPALQSAKPDLSTALKDGGRSATAGAGSQRLRGALVVAEVALAVMLLVGAGLFVGSFVRLMRIEPGFDYSNVMVFNVAPRVMQGQFDEAMRVNRTYVPRMQEAVEERARRPDGRDRLRRPAAHRFMEPRQHRDPRSWRVEGRRHVARPPHRLDRVSSTASHSVAAGPLPAADRHRDVGPVIVINDAAARLYWPGEEALGKRLKINEKERVIVGIVGDIRHLGPERPPRQEGYIPFAQAPSLGATLAIRTDASPMTMVPAVKAAIWSVNPEQRLTGDTVTMEGYMDRLITQRRFNMALLASFGVLGLVIAAVGIYGVMAYTVAQRTNEIGVRMALGATRGHVVSMVLKRAAALIALGLAIGGGASWFLSANVKTFLFQTEPGDPRILVGALVTLTLAGLAASAVPARRAASVDPLVALRRE